MYEKNVGCKSGRVLKVQKGRRKNEKAIGSYDVRNQF